MTECTQVRWAARTAAWPGEGDAILGAPRRNVLGTTALTPPLLAAGGAAMTNTAEAEAPERVDIHRTTDEMQAFRAAEEDERRRYVEALTETVAGLFERGQTKQALAVVRSLTRPGPFRATKFEPTDRRQS